MLIARRNLMAGKPLPYDAEVDYLQSDGKQFIDSGLFLTNEHEIYAKFSTLKNESFIGVCGSRVGASDKNISIGINFSVRRAIADLNNSDYNNFRALIITNNVGDVIEATSSKYKRFGTVNGVEYGNYKICNDVFATETTAKFFKVDGVDVGTGVIIYEGSILHFARKVLELKPVRFTNENGEIEGAMYDSVSGQLFRNAGTGAFGWKEQDGVIVPPQ